MNHKLAYRDNQINGWYCSVYNLFNDILDSDCNYCNEFRDESLAVLAQFTRFKRLGFFIEAKLIMASSEMNEKELHANFFTKWSNEADLAIADMNDEQLTAWRNEMAEIVLRGKVYVTKADEKLRQNKASKRPWLIEGEVTNNVVDMQGVKTRKERMSKLERLQADLDSIMGVEDSQGVISKVKREATEQGVKNYKPLSAAKTAQVTTTVKKTENDEPFDFSKLTD